MLGKLIDILRGDWSAIDKSFSLGVYGLGTSKVLRQVIQNGCETIIFVQTW